MSIVAIGGTGTVGSRVVGALTERGESVRVMTRSPDEHEGSSRVEYVGGDLADPASLPPVLDGAETLYLLTPLHPEERELGGNAVRAAKEAGTRYIVYHSVHRVREIPEAPHFQSKIEIQDDLEKSGIPHAVVMPNNYYQNEHWFKDGILEHGVYAQPIGSAGLSRVDVRDIAELTANVLLDPSRAGQEIPVVGPDVLTGEDCAVILSQAFDREIAYAGDDLDAWGEQAKQTMPEWLVEDFKIMYAHFQEHGLRATDADRAKQAELLGGQPIAYSAFATELAQAWL